GGLLSPDAQLPQITRLVTKYKPRFTGEVCRPAERGLLLVAAVDRFLGTTKDPRRLAARMLAQDLRTPLFQLEGYLRLYVPQMGEDFERGLKQVKALEDQLG